MGKKQAIMSDVRSDNQPRTLHTMNSSTASNGRSKKSNLGTIYVISYLRWEREWYETFEVQRARLLNVLARLHLQIAGSPNDADKKITRYFLLAGQTVILEDISAVRPDMLAMWMIYNAGGRLGIGPWYVEVDESLVTGEAMIRNLLAARVDAHRYGLKLMSVAYTPNLSGHSAQLPQILRGFDVDAAFLKHGAPMVHMPFRWEAPDGSSILVINHEPHYPKTNQAFDETEFVARSIEAQRMVRPEGPFLWLFDAGSSPLTLKELGPEVARETNLSITPCALPDYINALRQELPDNMRPALEGELGLQILKENTFLLPGTLSSRLYLKQENVRLQSYLSYAVEPLLTVALTHGKVDYPDNLRALLNYSWRLLLKNQSRHAIGGTGSDLVHRENELNYQRVQDNCEQIIQQVQAALPGTPHRTGHYPNKKLTYLMVWNAHNWPIKQVQAIKLDLPPDKHPALLRDANGKTTPFLWKPSPTSGGRLTFLAEAPATGYATYALELTDQPTPAEYRVSQVPGTSITNPYNGDTISIENGAITWKHYGVDPNNRAETIVEDMLRFYDSGDAGDAYNYSPPEPDVIVRGDLIQDTQMEHTPLYERLIVYHRMRITPQLRPDRGRARGVRLIELRTTITLYHHSDGVHLKTSFVNRAKDHRLRVHLRTGIKADTVLADSVFGIATRPARIDGPTKPPAPYVEGVSNTHPTQGLVAVDDGQQAMALLVRGLPEYEAIHEDDQTTLAITLVRAVGWLSRDDLQTRTAPVAPMIPIPDAQCQNRRILADYAICPMETEDPAAMLRLRQEFIAPLQVYQYAIPPERPERSYLSFISNMSIGYDSDGEGAILTAFKPAEKGVGWVVRCFNPHDQSVEVYLTPFKQPDTVQIVALSEDVKSHLPMDGNGQIHLTIDPQEIVTLRFNFTMGADSPY